jgi:phthalate 4,5-dioxygenase oxygenase subunit
MITRTRRRLLLAARALRDHGVPPPGAEDAGVFRDARGGNFVAADGADWQAVYTEQLANAWRPAASALRAAE